MELADSGIVSETLLTTGETSACASVKASADRIYVITESREVLVVSLTSQILSTVALGPSQPGVRKLGVGSNGDLLITEQFISAPNLNRLTSSRVSPSGQLRWQRNTFGVDGNTLFAQAEASNGDLTIAYTVNNQVGLRRFDANGLSTDSSLITSQDPDFEDLCVIDSDAYVVIRIQDAIRLQRFQFSTQTSIVADFPSDNGPTWPFMNCVADSIVMNQAQFFSHNLIRLRPDGSQLSQTRIWDRFHFGYFAQSQGRLAVLTGKPRALYGHGLRLSVYQGNTLLNQAERDDLPWQPKALQLVGSETHGALLATQGFGAIVVSDVNAGGRVWSRLVRTDYDPGENVVAHRPPFQMARRLDGGTDVLSGTERFYLLRYEPNGTETNRYPLRHYDGWSSVHELRHLSDGSVLAVTSGVLNLIHNGVQTTGNYATLSVTGENVNSLRFVGLDDGQCDFGICGGDPHTYFAGLSPQLTPSAGPYPEYPWYIDTLRLHLNGTIDYVGVGSGTFGQAEASRYSTNGSLIFGPRFAVNGTTGKTLQYATHPELGLLIALESSTTPTLESILLRIGATGNILWTLPLPFRATSVALDDFGRAGASGPSMAGNHLRILETDGSPWISEDCADRRTCAYAPEQVATGGTRWFAAGTSTAAPGSPARKTYVREYVSALFQDSFE